MRRSSGARLVVTILAGVALLLGTATAATAWIFWGPGFLEVEVRDESDGDVSLRIPAIAVQAALALIPEGVFPSGNADARRIIPAMDALCEALTEGPDGVYVEVESADETVRIAKEGGRLQIVAIDRDDHVRVEIPAAAFRWVAEALDRAARPSRRRISA